VDVPDRIERDRETSMTDHMALRRSNALGYELVERSAALGWVAWPDLVRPVPHLSSPIMRRRVIVPLPPDPDRLAFSVPPVRDVVGPMAWGMLIALPILVLIGWQVAVVGAVVATIYRAVDQRASRLEFSFADGFLGFRTTTQMAYGVREDNDVRWNWSASQPSGGVQR
jgi:hypothetical protein